MSSPWTPWIWPVLAAPFVGSVLGVLVRRLPRGEPVALARSACEHCARRLTPLELIPIVSYVALRGRCGGCGGVIAAEHLHIELAATALAASAAAAAAASGADAGLLWASCGFGWALIALGWIDWRHLRLPDALSLPLLLAGLAVTAWLDPAATAGNALAAAIGYVALRLLAAAYRALRGRSGLGEGDAKLLAAIGAWQGLPGLSQALLFGALLGLGYGMSRVWLRRGRLADAIPFGPFLAAAAWATQLLWLYSQPA